VGASGFVEKLNFLVMPRKSRPKGRPFGNENQSPGKARYVPHRRNERAPEKKSERGGKRERGQKSAHRNLRETKRSEAGPSSLSVF